MASSTKRVLASRWVRIGVPALIAAGVLAAVLVPLIGGATLITLHPSGVSSAGSWVTSPTANQWATYLDSADGQTTYAWVSSENNTCVVDFDDPGISVGGITSVTVAASVRDFSSTQEAYRLGMSDGTNTIWAAAAQTPSSWTTVSITSTMAPDGTTWDWTDITNLKGSLAHKRFDEGASTVVQTQLPTGDGDVSGTWAVTPTSPTTRYDKVDDATSTPDDLSTYISATAVGYSLFTASAFSVPSDATNIQLTITYRHEKTAAQACNIGSALKVGNTYYTTTDPGVNPASGTWTTTSYTYTVNPKTGLAWTAAEINGTDATNPLQQWGVDTSDAAPNPYVTMVYAEASYSSSTWNANSRLACSEMMVTVDYQADVVPPKVISATYVDKTHVDVSFDETLAAGSINATYFTLDGSVTVSGASLQADSKTVRLTTSQQSEAATTYTVTVANGAPSVTDLAGNAVVAPDNTAQFVSPDVQPPRVVSATAVDGTHVDVSFDETVAPGSCAYTYFSVDNGISVTGTSAVSAKVIRLTTSVTNQGTLYTVTVASGAPSVTDLVGNAVVAPNNTATYTGPDITGPTVTGVTQVDSTHFDVSFNETIAAGSVLPAYFVVDNGISVSGATQQSSTVARVTCSALSSGVLYTVTVNNGAPSVTDLAGNPCVAPSNTGQFTGVDITPPTLVSATAPDSFHVDVNFSEPVNQGTLNVAYFTADNGLSITATSAVDADTVRLTTTIQTPTAAYTITVPNGGATVKDINGNACVAPGNQVTFFGWGGEDVWVPAGVNVSVQATNAGIGFTFANVTAQNWLHVTGAGSPGTPPMHAPAGGYYNLVFDGTFTGNVSVHMPYNEGSVLGAESGVQCWKYSGGNWIDVTTGIDTALNRVTGTSTSFSGWMAFAPISAGDSPHGGYSTGTQKCKVCHAVHGAEDAANSMNGEKLLRSTVAAACDYCHVGGPFAATQVYSSSVVKYMQDSGFEHSIGTSITTIVDSNDSTTTNAAFNPANDFTIAGGMKCTSCHSVHGKDCIGGATPTNILKLNPNPSNATSVSTGVSAANYDPWFCEDCHTSNLQFAHDLPNGAVDTFSHIMTTSVATTLVAAGTTSDQCRDCHRGDSAGSTSPANSYPHYTLGKYFLKDAFDATGTHKYDSVCLDCHVSGTMW